jgi:fermentation-respiration switch protein FrsA (DUF1100 family)
MKRAVMFKSQGLNCSALLYIPDQVGKHRLPAVVMAHGLTGVKEQALPAVAEKFAAAGMVTFLFDYRYFGESEGEPRCQLFPLEQVEDYRNAISYLSGLEEVDPERIGIWGTSNSGGLVLYTGTFDRRVKAVVAQVPAIFNPAYRYRLNPQRWEEETKALISDRIDRYYSGIVNYVKVVAQGNQPCVLAGDKAYNFFTSSLETAPTWRNDLTVESLEKMREFDPLSAVHLLSPTPVMLIPAENDELLRFETITMVYEKLSGPKSVVTLPITHFDIYYEPWLSRAAGAAVGWFQRYL